MLFDQGRIAFHDSSYRAKTLEAGLFYIGMAHIYLRNSEFVNMSNVTVGYGFIARGINSQTGRRSIVGLPSYQLLSLMSNHFGKDLIKTILVCPKFSQRYIKGFNEIVNHNWLDVVTTKSKDSLFISIINKHPYDSANLKIEVKDFKIGDTAKVYRIYSENFWDANTFDEPNKIISTEFDLVFNQMIKLPNHSYTILAFPLKDDNMIWDDKLDIDVYPNPSSDIIIIKHNFNELKKEDVTIIDINGKSIDFRIIETQDNLIKLIIKSNGSAKYFIKISNEKKTIIKDIIMQK